MIIKKDERLEKCRRLSTKLLFPCILLQASLLYTLPAYAFGPQSFLGLNYSNPAALNLVKQGEVIVGGTELWVNTKFSGTYAGITSSAESHTISFIPYGRLAYRVDPKIVVGVDVTQPLFTAFVYPNNSFIASAAVNSFTRDVDISPRASFQVTEKLAVGVGLNFNSLYNAEASFAIPAVGILYNKADSWAYGYNLGLFYAARQETLLGLSYYSQITQHLTGHSVLGPVITSNLQSTAIAPQTISGEAIQFVAPNWLFDAVIRYSIWTPLRFLTLQNTAIGNVTIPLHYFNSFDYSLATKYDFNEQWSGLAKVEYGGPMQPTAYDPPALPTGGSWVFGVGAQYAIVKGFSAKLLYGYGFMDPANNIAAPLGQLVGHTQTWAHGVDFSLTYDI